MDCDDDGLMINRVNGNIFDPNTSLESDRGT